MLEDDDELVDVEGDDVEVEDVEEDAGPLLESSPLVVIELELGVDATTAWVMRTPT